VSGRGAEPVRHVYVHAPFCSRRCFYCDFAVTVRREADPEPWARALADELRWLESEGEWSLDDVLTTVFVGGGTPSLLGPRAMAALGRALGSARLQGEELEWTSEANPESLTDEVAAGWRAAGVNRLSLGVQSFQEPVLRWMGRLHGAAGARSAVETARGAGFENLSVDLIFGLPPSLDRDWSADLEAVLEMGLPHVSLYGLTAETGTPLGRQVSEGRVHMPPDERYRAEFLEARERLMAAGFRHYEVSNFALPGFESRHNMAYWRGAPYLGLGNSSHSYLPPVRRWNTRDWEEYRDALAAGDTPVAEAEVVDGSSALMERVWLGLRTSEGLRLEPGEEGAAARVLERWERGGLGERPSTES
jgi:oxygen-independent coproporphyrinogen-3 oxidase